MKAVVSVANEKDYPSLKHLYNEAGLSFQHALGDQFWLVELDSEVVAASRLSFENELFVLRNLVVDSHYRGRGFARLLLDAVRNSLGKAEAYCITLADYEPLLSQSGFEKIAGLSAPDFLKERLKSLTDNGQNAILLRRFNDIEVRSLTVDDIHGAMKLIQEFEFPQARHLSANDVRTIYSKIVASGGVVLGAFSHSAMIATCTVNICANLSWSGRPYSIVENIIVTESERAQGVGKAILLHAKHIAASKNCYKVALMTQDQSSVADEFYKSRGFSDDKIGYQVRFGA